MKIVLFASLIYIVVFFILSVFSLFVRFDISGKAYACFLFLLTTSFCVVAFFSTDNSNGTSGWDINRYNKEINLMRGKPINFAFKHGLYKDTVLANLLFFMVSRLNNNAWIQTISTFVSMCVFSYILCNEKRTQENSFSTQSLYTIMIYATVSFSTILLGVRWIMAVSFCVLGRYLYEKGNDRLYSIPELICYCIAVMIHNGVLLYLIIRFLSIFKSPIPKYFLCFFTLFLPYAEPLVTKNEYLHLAYLKITEYSNMNAPDYRVLIVNIALLFCFFMFEFFVNEKKSEEGFGQTFIMGLIGSLSIYHLFSRTLGMYVLMRGGIFAEQVDDTKQNILLKIVVLFLCGGLLAYQMVFMKTYWRFTIL